jgi:hypothetical protein
MKTVSKKLYFIAGVAPTDAERADAKALGITALRHAELAGNTHVEPCNVVAGAVPKAYLSVEGIQVVKSGPTANENRR